MSDTDQMNMEGSGDDVEVVTDVDAALAEIDSADCGTPGDVWVENPTEEESEEWDTSESPVGLKDPNPLTVEETKLMLATPEKDAREDVVLDEKMKAAFNVSVSNSNIPRTKANETPQEIEARECTFKPELISSTKKRTKASSHQYGVSAVPLKAPRPADTPTFTPNMAVSKSTDKKRQSASGSNYGKAAVVIKSKVAPALDFTPQLVETPKAKAMREKATPRYLASQEKFAKQGKQNKAEVAEKRQITSEFPKYSLYSDRPSTAPAQAKVDDKPTFVFDGMEDPLRKRAVIAAPPVKPTKFGAELKAKQTSRYATTAYTPSKTARPQTAKASTRAWGPTSGGSAEVIGSSIDKLEKPQQTKTAKTVTSAYAADVYKPKKAVALQKSTAATDPSDFNTSLTEGSPITLPAPPAPKSSSKKKFDTVSSSGYGVVMPEPSVPNKVNAINHRSLQSQRRSRDFRAQAAVAEMDQVRNGSPGSNEENEAPEFGTQGRAQINDLMTRAAKPGCSAVPTKTASLETTENMSEALPTEEQMTIL